MRCKDRVDALRREKAELEARIKELRTDNERRIMALIKAEESLNPNGKIEETFKTLQQLKIRLREVQELEPELERLDRAEQVGILRREKEELEREMAEAGVRIGELQGQLAAKREARRGAIRLQHGELKMTFKPNRKFRREYKRLFKKDPLLANTFLLLCELANEKG